MLSKIWSWFKTPALQNMQLQPRSSEDNALMMQFFTWDKLHDSLSWWQHFEAEIPHLAEMGITQVWLPPPNKAADATKGRGYDAYDLWDLGEFNQKGSVRTRWGTKAELLQACETARKHGIDIVIDAVLGHKLGADSKETFTAVACDPKNRLREISGVMEIEGWTSFSYPGRNGKYSELKWTQEHFTGLDWDQRRKKTGVYRIVGGGHQGWSKNVDKELGNYDYLLGVDIDHRHPLVRKDLLNWGPWVLQETGAVGFRLDAIKHYDYKFLLEFLRSCRRSTNSRMFAVAEYWSGDINIIKPYLRMFKEETAFFDVPLHYHFHEASKHGSRYDIRNIFVNTIVSAKPFQAVTFVDNHDTVVGQSLESWVDFNFKIQAYALILLRGHGYPCVFYGDMYPNSEGYSEAVASALRLLMKARKLYAYGQSKDYLYNQNCVGFVRTGDQSHSGCVVVISNLNNDSYIHKIRMFVGRAYSGAVYRSFMTEGGTVTVEADGWGTFTCFGNSVQVWART